LIPLASIAALANAGTLAAFIAVCAAMLVLRRREPDRERKFRAPAAWFVGIFGILGCLYLFISLPNRTQLFFLAAQVIGLVLYAIYGHGAAHGGRGNCAGAAPAPAVLGRDRRGLSAGQGRQDRGANAD
jgi:APA family basic amino acid/polyamine antiporter